MFTGIIEAIGTVKEIISNGSNKSFWVESPISNEFYVGQSINHCGVCLTIEEIKKESHRITAVKETLTKTNLDNWEPGVLINLERSVPITGRLDGHLVQGHVNTTSRCIKRKEKKGSWEFEFELRKKHSLLVAEKDSICVNGISLTTFNLKRKSFKVAVIPYTFDHTNMHKVLVSDIVNLEFNIIGKYVQRYMSIGNQLKLK